MGIIRTIKLDNIRVEAGRNFGEPYMSITNDDCFSPNYEDTLIFRHRADVVALRTMCNDALAEEREEETEKDKDEGQREKRVRAVRSDKGKSRGANKRRGKE